MDSVEIVKMLVREKDVPYFSDEEIQFQLERHGGDVDATVYDCLLIKAENTTLSMSGLSAADSSSYFRRLARRYKPNNSGVLEG